MFRLLLKLAPLALAACGGGAPQGDALGRLTFGGQAFGTGWGVILTVEEGKVLDSARVQEALVAELEAIDAALSTWREDSQISRFNRSAAGSGIEVGRRFLEVLAVARSVHAASGGAFDPTVGPLVDVWGFGAGGDRDGAAPTDEELARLRGAVGLEAVIHAPGDGEGAGRLFSAVEGLRLDLSAVAKGYAVDRLCELLGELGAPDHFVEIGGEVRVAGVSPRGGPWRVGVNRPTPTADGPDRAEFALELERGAVATSGDYRNYRLVDGRRLAHTIDPRTGRPVDQPPASVTVIAETCALADAWATALCVLGLERGLELIEERPDLEALFLVRDGDQGFARVASSGFSAALVEIPR
jgi:thiamine biosynthesis lipoprotein